MTVRVVDDDIIQLKARRRAEASSYFAPMGRYHRFFDDYERDTDRIDRGEKARNVSPECWRDQHETCECSALICRCECHRSEA